MDKPIDYRLYLIADTASCRPQAFLSRLTAALSGGVTLLQLRAKDLSARDFYHLTLLVQAAAQSYDVPLIINDRLDIALAAKADGVHLGQQDLPAAVARQLLGPERILGLSAKTPYDARDAVADGVDYLGVGALYATRTKSDADPLNHKAVARLKAKVPLPLVGIGGINEDNVAALADLPLAGVAVSSAIMASSDPRRAAEAIKAAFACGKEVNCGEDGSSASRIF